MSLKQVPIIWSLTFFLGFNFSFNSYSQIDLHCDVKNLSQLEIYIVCRGTNSKPGIIAKKFNSIDKLISHIGIGVHSNSGEFLIYHIEDTKTSCNKTALTIDDFQGFQNQKNEVTYLALYKLKLSNNERISLLKYLRSTIASYVIFDYDFQLENGPSKLYCSEFCFLALKNAFGSKMKNSFVKNKKLQNFNSRVLKRDTIKYIPTDFFLGIDGITKVCEIYFN